MVEAENGSAALSLLQDGVHVDLVFSDIVMPGGVSGYELAGTIRKTWPRLPVLLTSGFTPETSGNNNAAPGEVDILMKPYSQSALEDALWRALRGRDALMPD